VGDQGGVRPQGLDHQSHVGVGNARLDQGGGDGLGQRRPGRRQEQAQGQNQGEG